MLVMAWAVCSSVVVNAIDAESPAVQVYAYTTSELQVAILKLFVRAECRLPNLFVGTLTRESVTQALEFGVQADQIVGFMQQHAHPHVVHKVPVVPEVCLFCCVRRRCAIVTPRFLLCDGMYMHMKCIVGWHV